MVGLFIIVTSVVVEVKPQELITVKPTF